MRVNNKLSNNKFVESKLNYSTLFVHALNDSFMMWQRYG